MKCTFKTMLFFFNSRQAAKNAKKKSFAFLASLRDK